MKSQTSLIASQCRLQQWAKQIRDCQNRPADMQVSEWCEMNGITTANYYYRLRRVREACITEYQNTQPAFVELPVAQEPEPISVYCIIKIPTIAEGNPQSCMRIFPIIADVFGISLSPQ